MSLLPNAAVGDNVVFYIQADLQSPPIPAVVQFSDNGVLELATFPRSSTMIQPRRNVRHVDDPILKEREPIRQQYGGWDTVENAQQRRLDQIESARRAVQLRLEKKKEREKEEQESSDEYEQEIVRLKQEENMNAVEIAEEMTKKTKKRFTYQRVNAVLRRLGKLVAT